MLITLLLNVSRVSSRSKEGKVTKQRGKEKMDNKRQKKIIKIDLV